jgi:hypothetical protein
MNIHILLYARLRGCYLPDCKAEYMYMNVYMIYMYMNVYIIFLLARRGELLNAFYIYSASVFVLLYQQRK